LFNRRVLARGDFADNDEGGALDPLALDNLGQAGKRGAQHAHLGAAAAAQIALTHRDAASVVSFVAGQCKGLAEQNWAGLAGKGRTLVIYMGVKTAPRIAEKLMADGLTPEMPVAVIENACRPGMRVVRAPLASLPELVERERVKSPALIVIGEVTAREDATLRQFASEFAL
jgi:uroporphyrin-III C-methyltransferase